MKKMFVQLLCLVLLLTWIPVSGQAKKAQYLIPDSNTRALTEEELWQWDRESLSFIFNEIFARHGYVFISGGKYDQWFSAMPWYKPNKNADNSKYCLPKVTQLEWDNYHLIKKVIAEMDAKKTKAHDAKKKCYRDYSPPSKEWKLTGFSPVDLKAGQKLNVYSAPGTGSWRGANGRAMLNTNDTVWAAGWDGQWLLVFYETNNNSVRVGYVDGRKISGKVSIKTQLQFEKTKTTVSKNCKLTDDPLMGNLTITNLKKGAKVTYLTSVINQNGKMWDYIQTTVDGQKARGFIPSGCLNYVVPNDEDIDY